MIASVSRHPLFFKRLPVPARLPIAVESTCVLSSATLVTMNSGKIVQQWAGLTLESSPWAVVFYRAALARGLGHNDAIRRLANRWLEILWRIWMDAKPYDEKFHLAQHYLRTKSR